MRALLIHPQFPQTFFSYERTVKILGKKAVQPPLGLLTLAALLPGEWDLRLVDLTCRPLTSRDWDEADLVLLSGMIVQHGRLLELIREARKRGKIVVVGGPAVFHMAEEALRAGADLVVQGEGEVTVRLLLDHLGSREFGRVITASGKADLRDTPPPRYDLIEMDDYLDMEVQFSRGCPFECEFCLITAMLGRKVRTKEPRQVLDELEALYDRGWRRNVFFVDDNLIGNPGKAKALLRELIAWMDLKGHPFTFNCQASMNLADDPELPELLARAGFTKVFLGIESLDEESLRRAGKHQNLGVDLERACRRISRAGLQIQAGCIIGFDTDLPGCDRRFIDFARNNHIPDMFVSMLQTAPGTALWSRLEKEGRLLPLDDYENLSNNTGLLNFVPLRPLREIVYEFIRMYDVLYEPGFFLQRVYNHILHMPPPVKKKSFEFPYLFELRAVLIVMAKNGIVYRSRWRFWKCLIGVLLKCSGNLPRFFAYCVIGEHYFDYRRTIGHELTLRMRARDPDGKDGRGPGPALSSLDHKRNR